MKAHRPPITLSPSLGALMLAAFALSGLLVGLLTHGLAISLAAAQPGIPTPVSTSTHVITPTATLPEATGRFDLALTVSSQQITVGQTVTVTAKATVAGTERPMVNLICSLSGPDSGPSLLASWPAPEPTDAQGLAIWHITIPAVTPGTYAIQVKANTRSPTYGVSRIALIVVKQ